MKIAVFYYSQTGQTQSVAQNLFASLGHSGHDDVSVIYKPICPIRNYPFPWDKYEFFDIFPETRLNMPPSGIESIDFSDIEDSEVVVIVAQSWFLSPSLPLQSFFEDQSIKAYLNGRNIVFVNACRNMWLMTIRWIKEYLQEINAKLVGHIVLQDKEPNLISVATIVRWLIHGRKEHTRLLPSAGISDDDIKNARKFGHIIVDAVMANKFGSLQGELLQSGAIEYKPSILHIEKIGHRMFGYWAKFIRKKGGFGDQRRRKRVMLFYYYLVFALFFVSPFVQLLFSLTYPLRNVSKQKMIDCNI